MRTAVRAALFAIPVLLSAQSPAPPNPAEQKALVARMREAALNYSDRLQDFLCTELLTRTADTSGTGKKWKLLETRELELGYISHQEHYRLVKVNGKATETDKRVKRGYWTPGGEFGSSLLYIFGPKVAAEFTWDHEESAGDARSCVFRYHVPVATSSLVINADMDHVKVAHGGFVTADCNTGAVMRFQLKTEPASVKRGGRDIAIGMELDLRYAMTAIGSGEFLLPQHAIEMAPFGPTETKAEIDFRDYRKYEASSNIVFDDESLGAGK